MICIVFLGQIRLCPFVKKYEESLKKNNIEYEIIHWDREGDNISPEANIHTFGLLRKRYANPLSKITSLLKFRRYAIKIIKQKKYDKLVILTTLTGVILYPILIHKYKGKYIFDYRDASFEYIKPFNYLVKKLVKCSNFTCVSSPGFRNILPKGLEYVNTHNFKYDDLKIRNTQLEKKVNEPINVSYLGVLREIDYLKDMIIQFKDDIRFNLYIHGGGDSEQELRDFSKDYKNVFVTGKFAESEKAFLINNADIIIYNYPCSYLNNNALANKFYDGIIFKKPLFANIDTFNGKLVEKNGLGCSLENRAKNVADRLYDYYISFDEKAYCKNAEKMLDKVVSEDEIYLEKLDKFFSE